ncbi:AbrB family transcriptional regulator [Rhodovulum sp. DZ06]|uniref:AbrB family transcriptional regulator n=1 Tax=Rhodovulum sp. DZ06 TaxID=3425126 RepID=UPI003D357175
MPLPPLRALLPTGFALALGLAGGLAATALGAPLPMLLGSLVAVGAATVAGWTPGGIAPAMPQATRLVFIPVIGVSIGAAFTPAVLAEAPAWWPTLLGLLVYLPLAHAAGFLLYRRARGLDAPTAFYAAAPGGLIDAIALGEEAGAQMRPLVTLQFLRLILSIMCVPLAFMLLTGEAVGSAAGARLAGADAPIGAADVAILLGAGAVGSILGRRWNLPAGVITGPILLSGAAHLAGLTGAAPPDWMLGVTQLAIGASLGGRFAGLTAGEFFRFAALAAANMVATMSVALAAAALLHGAVGQRTEAVILAYAPGGLAEMSLVAVSMQISVVYVTAHHVARLLLSVALARAAGRRIAPPRPGGAPGA